MTRTATVLKFPEGAQPMKDYRQYLRSVGIKPLKGRLRTEKEPGSVEIAYDPRTGDWEKFTHEGEVSNVVPLRKRRVA